MDAIKSVTLQDLWSYFSNKVASKVNDPFDELNGIVVPIKDDGTFAELIRSDEFDNIYDWIANLCRNTHQFPTSAFGFIVPGWKKDPETLERVGETIMLVLVKSYDDMEVGIWDLTTNEVNLFPEQHMSDSHGDGPVPMALGALSVGIEIERGGMGEAGRLMREAKQLIMRGEEMAANALAMLDGRANN